jgi:hypothetical protein
MFHNSEQYQLYDQASIRWKPDLTGFSVIAPWLELEVDVEADQASALFKTSERVQAHEHTLEADQAFLALFREYPLLRVLPRIPRQIADLSLKEEFPDFPKPSDLEETFSTAKADSDSINRNWEWRIDEILEGCKIASSDLYDPLSAYSLIRELRLKSQYSNSKDTQILRSLGLMKTMNESLFFKTMIRLLSQTYFITSSCENAISPALSFPLIQPLVTDFLAAEHGHHHLVMDSLRGLEGTYDLNVVFPETKESIALLTYSAAQSALAFSCLVGAFEGNDYSDVDPLATLLLESSRPAAALGIQRHYLINKEGNHSAVGESFVRMLGPVTRSSVIFSAHLTELLCLYQNTSLEKILTLWEPSQ